MAELAKPDWYWPLASLNYEAEIADGYADEAQLIGAITILWNNHEKTLKCIFVDLLSSRKSKFVEAIWDRQPTHQAKRDLLTLALTTLKLSKRQINILNWVIDNTKTLADRRNELIHAEYVVHHRTYRLHAKVRSPRSNKPAKFQPVGASDLKGVVEDLSFLIRATESAYIELSPRMRRAIKSIELGMSPQT